jgi:hypothetical protein
MLLIAVVVVVSTCLFLLPIVRLVRLVPPVVVMRMMSVPSSRTPVAVVAEGTGVVEGLLSLLLMFLIGVSTIIAVLIKIIT